MKSSILIVEDQTLILLTLEEALLSLGYHICGKLKRGEDVAGFLETNSPDLILMDIILEGKMDGVDVVEYLKNKYDIPIVYLTGASNTKMFERAKLSNPYGYIVKPFKNRELKDTIEIALYKHKTESQLKHRENSLKISQEIAKIGSWDYNYQTGEENWSDELFKILGYDVNEVRPSFETFIQHVVGEDQRELIRHERKRHSSDELKMEYHILCNKKQPKFVIDTLRYVYDQEGKLINAFGTIQDITELKLTSFKLDKSEKRFKRLFENSPIGVIMIDKSGNITNCNSSFSRMMGYEPGELVGVPLKPTLDPHVDKEDELIKMMFSSEIKEFNTEGRYLRKNGEEIDVNIIVSTVVGEDNKVINAIFHVTDITEKKSNEKTKLAIYNISKKSNENCRKEEFLSFVAQELKKIISFDEFYITRYHKGLLEFTYFEGDEGFRRNIPSRSKGNGLSEFVIKNDKELLLNHEEIKAFSDTNQIEIYTKSVSSWVGVPLKKGNGVIIGNITLQSFDSHAKFKRSDLELISYISSQVGLYLEKKINDDLIQNVVMATSVSNGEKYFDEVTSFLCSSLDVKCALIGKYIESENAIQTLSISVEGKIQDDVYYTIPGTPTEQVKNRGFFIHEGGMQNGFPFNENLKNLKVDSCIGISLVDDNNEFIGVLSVMEDKPMTDLLTKRSFLNFIKARAAGEVQRYRLEREIRQNEQKFRELFENSIDEVYLVDPNNFEILHANLQACKELGYSSSEVEHLSFKKILDDPEKMMDQIKQIIKDKKVAEITLNHRRKDKSTYPCEFKVKMINYDGRDLILGMARNITKKLEFERKLLDSEQRWRSLVNNSQEIIAIIDKTGVIKYINKIPEHALKKGVSKSAVIGSNFDKFIEPLDKVEDLSGKLQSSFVNNSQFEIYMKGIETNTIYDCKAIPLNERGESSGFIVLATDITEKLKITEAIKKSEEKFKSVYLNSPIGILTISNDGMIVLANERIERDLGYSRGELTSKNIKKVFRNISEENGYQKFMKENLRGNSAEEGRSNLIGTILVRKESGENIPMEITLNYFEDIEGEEYTIALLQNLEDTQKAEKAVTSLKEKEILLKEIHHRVKNNMQIISSLLTLQEHKIQNPELSQLHKASKERIMAMALVHEQLYRSSNFSKVNSKDYIMNLLNYLRESYITEVGIDIESYIDDFEIDIDQAIPCGLIINEIVSNSYKHAFVDIKKPKIVLEFKQSSNQKTILITDNGRGIDDIETMKSNGSLGITLIQTLSRQIKAELKIENKEGLHYMLSFK